MDTGTTVLEAATQAGIYLGATCGGAGTCGACQVIIKDGQVEDILRKGHNVVQSPATHQACQSRVLSNLVVEVPPAARLKTAVLALEGTPDITGSSQLVATGWPFAPVVRKVCLNIPPPSINDNSSDLERLRKGLQDVDDTNPLDVPLEIVRELSSILRTASFQITATLLFDPNQTKLIRLESGDTRIPNLAMAFDIGTTAVRGQTIDLDHGTVLTSAVAYNGQINYGADVISRIMYCQKPGGLASLQQAVVATINQLIQEMLEATSTPLNSINHVTVAANTVMVHILLAVDPQPLRLSPYVPTFSEVSPIKGLILGLNVAEFAYVSFLPSVASYVGGDIVAGVISTGIYQQDKLTLYIDIGTNGEIVAGTREWMISAAASAGPTFEGGGIQCGMLATGGAIDRFELGAASGEPSVSTIGGEKPRGICGAGLITIAAVMLSTGLIGQNGRFNPDIASPRLRTAEGGLEYVLVWGQESGTGRDVVITEIDLDNLIRAKAAIFASCQTLLKSLGNDFDSLERVVIAGNFGSHLNIEHAVAIGLLPDLPRESFVFVGNGSLLGARLCTFSTALRADASRIARQMTNIELSENADFMTNYVAALFMPHTNYHELFPSVKLEVPL